MKLTVEATGQLVVARQLLAMAGRVEDATPAMDAVIDGLYESAAKQFDTAGAYGGTPWPSNAPSTVERKALQGLDPRILHATLDLRDSLTKPGGANVAIARPDGVIFDTTIDYARYLKERYPMVQPREVERRQWVKAVQRWIIDGDQSRGGILGGIV